MIRLDAKPETVSERIRTRSAAMAAEVVRYISDFENVLEVHVEPDEPEKGKVAHTVHFIHMRDRAGSYVGVLCFETKSLVYCKANQSRRYCSHVHAAIREVETQAKATKELTK